MTRRVVMGMLLPGSCLVATLAYYAFYNARFVDLLTPQATVVFHRAMRTLIIFSVAFAVQRSAAAMLAWYRDNVAARTASRLDDELIPLIRRTANVIIWVVALLVTLPLYGVNISALITALGVTSLAIALAAQDTIANVIAGFLIMVDRPFREGDSMKLPSGEKVIALEIGVRRSRFLAEDGSIIIVPNLDLSKSKIVNFTYGEERKAEPSSP